jgi:hypothetical protein
VLWEGMSDAELGQGSRPMSDVLILLILLTEVAEYLYS